MYILYFEIINIQMYENLVWVWFVPLGAHPWGVRARGAWRETLWAGSSCCCHQPNPSCCPRVGLTAVREREQCCRALSLPCSLAAPACLLQPVNRRWQCLFSHAAVGGRAQPGKTSPAPSILWEWQWAGITMLQLRTAVPLSALAAFPLITWILGIPQSHWVLGCSSTFARLIHLFSRRDLSLCFSHDSIF